MIHVTCKILHTLSRCLLPIILLATVSPFLAHADGMVPVGQVYDGDTLIRFEMARDSNLARTEGIQAHRRRVRQMRQHVSKISPKDIPMNRKQHTKMMKRACRGFTNTTLGGMVSNMGREIPEEIPQELTEDYVAWFMVGAFTANEAFRHALNQPDHVDGVVKQVEDMLLNHEMYMNIAIAVPFMVGSMAVLNQIGLTDPLCQLYTKHIHTAANVPDWKKKLPAHMAKGKTPKATLIQKIYAKVGNVRKWRTAGMSVGMAFGMLAGQQTVELLGDIFSESDLSKCTFGKKRIWESYAQARGYYEACTRAKDKWLSYQRTATVKSQITSGAISALISFGGVEALGNFGNAQKAENILRESNNRRRVGKAGSDKSFTKTLKGYFGKTKDKVINITVRPFQLKWAATSNTFRTGQYLAGAYGTSSARKWMIQTYGIDPKDPATAARFGINPNDPRTWKVNLDDPEIRNNPQVKRAISERNAARDRIRAELGRGASREVVETAVSNSLSPASNALSQGRVPLDLKNFTRTTQGLKFGTRQAAKLLSTRFIGGVAVGLPAQFAFFFLDILVFQPIVTPIYQLHAHGLGVDKILNQVTTNYQDFTSGLGSAGPLQPDAEYVTVDECYNDLSKDDNYYEQADPWLQMGRVHHCDKNSNEGLAKEPTEALVTELRKKTREYVSLAAQPLNEVSQNWKKALYFVSQSWKTAEKIYRHIVRNGHHETLMPLPKNFNFFQGEGRANYYGKFRNVVDRLYRDPTELAIFVDNLKLFIDDIISGEQELALRQQSDIDRLKGAYLKLTAGANMVQQNSESQAGYSSIWTGLKMLVDLTYDQNSGLGFYWYDETELFAKTEPQKVMRKTYFLDPNGYNNSVDNLMGTLVSPIFGPQEKKISTGFMEQFARSLGDSKSIIPLEHLKRLKNSVNGKRKDPYVYIRTQTKLVGLGSNPELDAVLNRCVSFRQRYRQQTFSTTRDRIAYIKNADEAAYADMRMTCEEIATAYLDSVDLMALAQESEYSASNLAQFAANLPKTREHLRSFMWASNGLTGTQNDLNETITSITLYGLLETLGYPFRLKKPYQTVFKELIAKISADGLLEKTMNQKRKFKSVKDRGHWQFGMNNYRAGFHGDGEYSFDLSTNLDSVLYEMLCGFEDEEYLGFDTLRQSWIGLDNAVTRNTMYLKDGRRPYLRLPEVTLPSPKPGSKSTKVADRAICGPHLSMIPYIDTTSTFMRSTGKPGEESSYPTMPVHMWITADTHKSQKPEYFPTFDRAYESILDFTLHRIDPKYITSEKRFEDMWQERFVDQLDGYIDHLHGRYESELKRIKDRNNIMWRHRKGAGKLDPDYVDQTNATAFSNNNTYMVSVPTTTVSYPEPDKSVQHRGENTNRGGDAPLSMDFVRALTSVKEDAVNNTYETEIKTYIQEVLSTDMDVKPGENLRSVYGQLISEHRVYSKLVWSYLIKLNGLNINSQQNITAGDISRKTSTLEGEFSAEEKSRIAVNLLTYDRFPKMKELAGKLWRLDRMLRVMLQIFDSRIETTECGTGDTCKQSKQLVQTVISETMRKLLDPNSKTVNYIVNKFAEDSANEAGDPSKSQEFKFKFEDSVAQLFEKLGFDDATGELTAITSIDSNYFNTFERQDKYFALGYSMAGLNTRMLLFDILSDYLKLIEEISSDRLSDDHKVTHKSVAYSLIRALEENTRSTYEYAEAFDQLNLYLDPTNGDVDGLVYEPQAFFDINFSQKLGKHFEGLKLTCDEIAIRDRVYQYRVDFLRSAECEQADLSNISIKRYKVYRE